MVTEKTRAKTLKKQKQPRSTHCEPWGGWGPGPAAGRNGPLSCRWWSVAVRLARWKAGCLLLKPLSLSPAFGELILNSSEDSQITSLSTEACASVLRSEWILTILTNQRWGIETVLHPSASQGSDTPDFIKLLPPCTVLVYQWPNSHHFPLRHSRTVSTANQIVDAKAIWICACGTGNQTFTWN